MASAYDPKILNTLFHTFLSWILLFMKLFLKTSIRMVNSVDPVVGTD